MLPVPVLYECRVVRPYQGSDAVTYRDLSFFTLVVGEVYEVLIEADHPSIHPHLPLHVDEGEGCILLVRRRLGSRLLHVAPQQEDLPACTILAMRAVALIVKYGTERMIRTSEQVSSASLPLYERRSPSHCSSNSSTCLLFARNGHRISIQMEHKPSPALHAHLHYLSPTPQCKSIRDSASAPDCGRALQHSYGGVDARVEVDEERARRAAGRSLKTTLQYS